MKQALAETAAASTQLPVTSGSCRDNSNKNDKNNASCDQSGKTRSVSTVAPATYPPNDHTVMTVADTLKFTS